MTQREVRERRRTPVDFTGKAVGPSRSRAARPPMVVPDEHVGRIDLEPMPDPDDIPRLLDWVGYDPQRAKAAVVAELDRESVRSEVLESIEAQVSAGAHA